MTIHDSGERVEEGRIPSKRTLDLIGCLYNYVHDETNGRRLEVMTYGSWYYIWYIWYIYMWYIDILFLAIFQFLLIRADNSPQSDSTIISKYSNSQHSNQMYSVHDTCRSQFKLSQNWITKYYKLGEIKWT